MSQVLDLCKAELNKDYIVHKIKNNNKVYENYGIFENAPIVPLYRSMGKNISAYKTYYGIFAIRNETAENIKVRNVR